MLGALATAALAALAIAVPALVAYRQGYKRGRMEGSPNGGPVPMPEWRGGAR